MTKKPLHVRLIETFFPLRFILARFTRFAPIGKLADKILFEHDDLFYLPRDDVIEINREVDAPESMVVPSRVVEHFIDRAEHRFIMDFCICREAAQCQEHPIELGCLFLGEATKHIDRSLGHEATREEALAHLRRCREAGLVHLVGRNKLDTRWLNAHPGEKLLTVCSCCPCCCLWLMLPRLEDDIASKLHRMDGVSVAVGDACTGCGACIDVCFVDAISIEDGRAVIGQACRACGRCAELCPGQAITVSIDADAVERAVERINDVVDVS
ncbi:MAG: 4Fe-4S binding protein [Thermoplasmatota archaeon]